MMGLNQIERYDSLLFDKAGNVYLHNKITKSTIILKVVDVKEDSG